MKLVFRVSHLSLPQIPLSTFCSSIACNVGPLWRSRNLQFCELGSFEMVRSSNLRIFFSTLSIWRYALDISPSFCLNLMFERHSDTATSCRERRWVPCQPQADPNRQKAQGQYEYNVKWTVTSCVCPQWRRWGFTRNPKQSLTPRWIVAISP